MAHKKPDCDTLSSVLAMNEYLKFLGKSDVKLVCSDKPNSVFSFIPNVDLFEQSVDFKDFDLIICLDLGALIMTGFPLFNDNFSSFENSFFVNIDHHISNDSFADLNIVDPNAASTTVLVYRFFKFVGFDFFDLSATYIMNGLYSDTGSFMHDNTSEEVFNIAFDLMMKGAKIYPVTKKLFNTRSVKSLKLLARVLSNARFTNKGAIVSHVSYTDFYDFKARNEHLSGAIEYLNMVPNSEYSLLLNQMKSNKLKGSFRTQKDNVDVAKLAEGFGSGGHKKAAGFLCDAHIEDDFSFRIVFDDMSKRYFEF